MIRILFNIISKINYTLYVNYFRENIMLKSLMAIVVFILIPLIGFSAPIFCPETSTAESIIGPALLPPSFPFQKAIANTYKKNWPFTVQCIYYDLKRPGSSATRTITSKLATPPLDGKWQRENDTHYTCISTKPEDCGIDSSNISPDNP